MGHRRHFVDPLSVGASFLPYNSSVCIPIDTRESEHSYALSCTIYRQQQNHEGDGPAWLLGIAPHSRSRLGFGGRRISVPELAFVVSLLCLEHTTIKSVIIIIVYVDNEGRQSHYYDKSQVPWFGSIGDPSSVR